VGRHGREACRVVGVALQTFRAAKVAACQNKTPRDVRRKMARPSPAFRPSDFFKPRIGRNSRPDSRCGLNMGEDPPRFSREFGLSSEVCRDRSRWNTHLRAVAAHGRLAEGSCRCLPTPVSGRKAGSRATTDAIQSNPSTALAKVEAGLRPEEWHVTAGNSSQDHRTARFRAAGHERGRRRPKKWASSRWARWLVRPGGCVRPRMGLAGLRKTRLEKQTGLMLCGMTISSRSTRRSRADAGLVAMRRPPFVPEDFSRHHRKGRAARKGKNSHGKNSMERAVPSPSVIPRWAAPARARHITSLRSASRGGRRALI